MRNPLATNGALLGALAAVALLRLATLGAYPLMDTTEARYAEIARKMVELGDWVTPWYEYGVPFWGKPPLSFWLTAASFKLFGVNELAARLPHFLAALAVAWLVWSWSARRSGREAFFAMALLAGSVLYVVAAGAVTTDMALALGTTLAMRGFWLGLHGAEAERRRERWLLFLGLAVGLLAKGPVALLLVGVPVALWTLAGGAAGHVWRGLPWWRGALLTLALAAPWYVLAEARTPGFLAYFLVGEHWHRYVTPGWSGDLYGNAHAFARGSIWLFAFAAFLPWSLLLPLAAGFGRRAAPRAPLESHERAWRRYLLFWAFSPALIFTAAGNILATYVLPGLPALALLAAAWLARLPSPARAQRTLALGLLLTLAGVVAALVYLDAGGVRDAKTAQALVAAYASQRAGDERLVFLGRLPYSAAFYSRGKAEQAPDVARLERRLNQGPAFVALRTEESRALPARLLHALERVGRYGKFELFRYAPGAPPRDPPTRETRPSSTRPTMATYSASPTHAAATASSDS